MHCALTTWKSSLHVVAIKIAGWAFTGQSKKGALPFFIFTTMEFIMAAILVLTSLFALIALSAMLRGYVLSVLWGWFIVPTFGLPGISIPIAIGIGIILSFTTHQISAAREKQSTGDHVFNIVAHPLLVLLIGWIVTLFM